VRDTLGRDVVTERRACRVLGQARNTQRRKARVADDEPQLELPDKAIELKYTRGSLREKDIITKFFKYRAAVGPGKPLELRSLDDVSTMQAFVDGAFEKYMKMTPAEWPRWLQRLAGEGNRTMLQDVKDAISYTQATSTRYNYFAAAG
jgi:hypothetical protein